MSGGNATCTVDVLGEEGDGNGGWDVETDKAGERGVSGRSSMGSIMGETMCKSSTEVSSIKDSTTEVTDGVRGQTAIFMTF